MQKVKITKISRNEKTSAGGIKYISLGLQIEGKEAWINGFGNKDNQDWKEGDEVEIKIVEKVVNGKTYLNFETPKKEERRPKTETEISQMVGNQETNMSQPNEMTEEMDYHLKGVAGLQLWEKGADVWRTGGNVS